MKRHLSLLVALAMLIVGVAPAYADFPGDMRRYYKVGQAMRSGTTPVPNFTAGFQIDGTDYTAAELQAIFGSGTILATGITAGTTQSQAGATALTADWNNVTTVGTAGDGVKLPTAVVGKKVTVRNSAAANTLKVWPFLGDNLNALAVNLSIDLPALSEVTFTAIDSTTWYSQPTALYLSSPTTLTGGLQIKAAASAGNTTTLITNASQAAARTYTIPDGGTNANFLLSEGAKTVNGAMTLGDLLYSKLTTGITAFATGGQASAVALTSQVNIVTVCATAGDSVKLPAAVAGLTVKVINRGAAACAVFPATGDAIDALAVNLSVDIPTLGEATFSAIDGTTWYSTPTVLYLSSPTTQTGGTKIVATANSGNTINTITNAAQSGARTWTIPSTGSTANFGMYATAGAAAASEAVTLDSNSWFDGTKVNGLDYSIAAAGTAYAPSASTEAVMNLGTYTIAANRLQALGYVDFNAVVLVGAINATDTFTVRVRIGGIGGTAVATQVQGASTAAGDYSVITGRIDVRSIVTTTCTMTSHFTRGGLEGGAALDAERAFVAAFTKDSTATLDLVVTGQFSTNSATNSATLQVFDVDVNGA